jgi:hypothetical protein
LKVYRDSNSQNGNSFGSVKVHSLTLSHISESMKCDSWASLFTRTFRNPCIGREPKTKIATIRLLVINLGAQGPTIWVVVLFWLPKIRFLDIGSPFEWGKVFLVELDKMWTKIEWLLFSRNVDFLKDYLLEILNFLKNICLKCQFFILKITREGENIKIW